MEEMEELKRRLERERPVPWEDLPDLALYMDQVISYMPRQLIRFDEEEQLTAAMVNNYIKDGLVPRASGKRYGPAHLSCLTAVCALKRVLPVKDIRVLLQASQGGLGPEAAYDHFTRALDGALTETAGMLDPGMEEKDLPAAALSLALRSYADQLACLRILDILRERTEAHKEAKPGEARKKGEGTP